MGSLTSYALASAVCLACCWGVYRLTIGRCKQPSFNRLVIMVIYIVSALMPLVALRFSFGSPGTDLPGDGGAGVPFEIPAISAAEEIAGAPLRAEILVGVYIVGAVITLLLSAVSLGRLALLYSRSRKYRAEGHTIAVIPGERIAPFSWGGVVFLSEGDFESWDRMILEHEFAHADRHHWVDLLVAQAVCVLQWFNPAAWLIRSDLRMLHEYQADEAVLGEGADSQDYQRLLLARTFLARGSQGFMTSNLNTSNLKKRIIMMKRNESGLRSRFGALALLPALALALGLTTTDSFATLRSETSDVKIRLKNAPAPNGAEVQSPGTDEKPFKEVEKLPEFPGGVPALMEWLGANIRYPEGMKEEGRVIVTFTVAKDGHVMNPQIIRSLTPEADAEVLRLFDEMPNWIPGENEGKKVACLFTLPVAFKLQPEADPAKRVDIRSERSERTVERTAPSARTSATTSSMSSSTSTSTSTSTSGATTVLSQSVSADGKGVTADSDGVRANFKPGSKDSPVIYVNGVLFTGDLNSIDPENIESMKIDKTQDRYPNGRIDIKLKR